MPRIMIIIGCVLIKSMFQIGMLHENGQGVKQDLMIATDWYRKAKLTESKTRTNGFAKDRNNQFYLDTKKGLEEVEYTTMLNRLIKKASEGDPETQYQLAINYDYGNLVPHDFNMALDWYRKTATKNHKSAQFKMGYFNFTTLTWQSHIRFFKNWN